MGWIYKTQFDNYAKAENHFKAAMQADPLYPHPYFHLASIYFDLDKFDLLKTHLEKCQTIATLEKAWIYYRYGMMHETNNNYEQAITQYEQAILHSFNNEKISDYKSDIERCKTKMEIK